MVLEYIQLASRVLQPSENGNVYTIGTKVTLYKVRSGAQCGVRRHGRGLRARPRSCMRQGAPQYTSQGNLSVPPAREGLQLLLVLRLAAFDDSTRILTS